MLKYFTKYEVIHSEVFNICMVALLFLAYIASQFLVKFNN